MKKRFLVLNYTADRSGSTIALQRLLDTLPQNSIYLISAPESPLLIHAQLKNWEYTTVKIPRLKKSFSIFYWIKFWKNCKHYSQQVNSLLNSLRPDFLLVNCSVNLGWLLNYKKSTYKPKIIWMIHELKLNPAWVFKWIIKKVQKNADNIICVSNPVARLFSSKTHHIPNIVPFQKKLNFNSTFDQSSLKFLWVGTVSPRKGLHTLTNLFSGLLEKFPNLELEITGTITSNYRSYFDYCVREIKSLGIKISIFENIDNMDEIFSSEKILLGTSILEESFNLPIIESMAHGMLVVAPIHGGVSDYGIHNTNMLDLNITKKNFVDELQKLRDNVTKLEEIKKSARKTAAEFTPEIIGKQFLKIIDQQ